MRRALLPLSLLAAVALVVTWLLEPNLIIGLRSPRALAWAGGLGLLCAGLGLAVFRWTGRVGIALAVAALPGLVATGLFVVRPILNPRQLEEALPSTGADLTHTSADPAPGSPTPSAATPAALAPTRVAAGELRGLAGHDAKGRVATYRLADGSHVVRFEDVDIGGTPSPHVYVVRGADQRKKGGIHLGELKAEKGSFNYVLPEEFAPGDFTVLVWCEQFAVEIANATQA
ncbi:MAG TPA: DM13 domain-containing protein [Mycobacteriales bacterium]|nr:DM13 domain-containing protein [Mycobacteriales bacterium]